MTTKMRRASTLMSALLLSASVLAVNASAQETKPKTELFAPGAGHAAHQQPSFSGGPQSASTGRPSLYEGLGKGSFPVTTASPQAQAYFDQGLKLTWAFNHAEARRAFQEAQRLDPAAPCPSGAKRSRSAPTSTTACTRRRSRQLMRPSRERWS